MKLLLLCCLDKKRCGTSKVVAVLSGGVDRLL